MEPECTREKAVDATGIETYWIGSKAAVTYQGAGANIFYKVISCKNSHILKWMEKKHGYNVLGEHINWKYVRTPKGDPHLPQIYARILLFVLCWRHWGGKHLVLVELKRTSLVLTHNEVSITENITFATIVKKI